MQNHSKNTKDNDTNNALKFIYDNAMGNPIILNGVPTSEQMKTNTWGVYGEYLYVKFANKVLLRFTGTVVV